MLSTYRLQVLLAGMLSIAASLHAQKPPAWPVVSEHPKLGTIDVVTVSEPSARKHCRVHSVTSNSIICGNGFGRTPITYQKAEISLLIDPPTKVSSAFYVVVAIGIAALAGSFYVSLPAAIALRVLTTWTVFATPWVYMDDDCHSGDRILYEQPGTLTAVKLR